jgi:ribosomal protein L22
MATNVTLAHPAIEAHALARHVRMSAQKVRLVVDLIRGRKANDAIITLLNNQVT